LLYAFTIRVDQTRDLAAAIAELARPGDLVLLAGDLGAGKTAFAQGFGRGLGITDAITSPTFTLARQYDGRLLLHHLDVYRLEQLEEVFDVGLPEILDEGAVTLIEWGDVVIPALPADFLEVRLVFGVGDDDRELLFRTVGPSWAARQRALATAVAPWAREVSGASPAVGDAAC
jgi:tRNA threonylcarbamoyladenosine biosynthesis protein TsaE